MKLKLAIDYTVFDGVELLEYAIKEIRESVDFINVTFQNKSYYGNPISQEDLRILLNLRKRNLIDNLLLFHIEDKEIANDSYNAKILEVKKRNYGKQFLLDKGFEYFINCDCDEIYRKEQFEKAKHYIIENNIDFSGCYFINYHNKPTIQACNISNSIVPFICKLDENYPFTGGIFIGKSDPTRSFNLKGNGNEKTYLFDSDQLLMHHFTTVRKDLSKKYDNTSLACLEKNNNNLIPTIQSIDHNNLNPENNFKIIDKHFRLVNNYFNINI